MSKSSDSQVFLGFKLPLELIAKIASYRDGWCGASEKDCYKLLKFWLTYKPRRLE